MMADPSDWSDEGDPPPRGFVSHAGKAIVRRRAIGLGVALAAIQTLVPLGFVAAMLVAAVDAARAPSIDVAQGAFWRGSVWLVERTPGLSGRGGGAERVVRWSPAAGGAPRYAKLPAVDEPFVLAAGGALWVVGRDRCVVMARDRLDAVAVSPRLARYLSHPFELDGKPAVVAAVDWASKPALFALDRDGGWKIDGRVDVGTEQTALPPGPVVVLPDGGRLRVFAAAADGIAHLADAAGFTDLPLDRWEKLPASEGLPIAWAVGRVGGAIAAFAVRRDGLSLAVDTTRLGAAGAWTPPTELPLDDVLDLSVHDTGSGGRSLIVAKNGDGGVTAYEMAGAEVAAATRLETGPMDAVRRLNTMSAWITVISTAAAPIVLLLALAGALRRFREGAVEIGGRRVALASLPRRCAAGAVDCALAAGPLAAAYAAFLFSYSAPGDAASGTPWTLVWLGVASLWALAALLAISFVEGRTGSTPGNRICGVRTVRLDLGAPGFGRALLRNFLVVIDAAFGFALAIALIALTPSQQRLGDLAAKTIVVFLPRDRE